MLAISVDITNLDWILHSSISVGKQVNKYCKIDRTTFSNILKFTRQPGGQSDIVCCYSGLQI